MNDSKSTNDEGTLRWLPTIAIFIVFLLIAWAIFGMIAAIIYWP